MGLKRGDVVVHRSRPEWGEGTVDRATEFEHKGTPAQRVVVRFANRGLVTVNTAVAPLVSKSQRTDMTRTQSSTHKSKPAAGGGWLAQLEQQTDPRELWSLPEALSDPFVDLETRLRATLATFRFEEPSPPKNPVLGPHPHARGLLDWAVAQTGLNDPLSQHTRHELEQAYRRFARDRDQHLAQLVRTAKREGEAGLLTRLAKELSHPRALDSLRRASRA